MLSPVDTLIDMVNLLAEPKEAPLGTKAGSVRKDFPYKHRLLCTLRTRHMNRHWELVSDNPSLLEPLQVIPSDLLYNVIVQVSRMSLISMQEFVAKSLVC